MFKINDIVRSNYQRNNTPTLIKVLSEPDAVSGSFTGVVISDVDPTEIGTTYYKYHISCWTLTDKITSVGDFCKNIDTGEIYMVVKLNPDTFTGIILTGPHKGEKQKRLPLTHFIKVDVELVVE